MLAHASECLHNHYRTASRIVYDDHMIDNHKHAKGGDDMAKTYSATELANEIGVNAKVLRSYLRRNHTRVAEAKNTTWVIDAKVANAAKKAFAKNRAQ